MNTDQTPSAADRGSELTEGLGLAPERDSFGELLYCVVCGGRPYAYDMRGTDTHEICTVECDACNHSVEAETRAAAAAKWNAGRA